MFNWSEVHLYRSNFLQNPYFSSVFQVIILSKETRPLVSSQMLLSRNVKLILTHAHNVAFSVKLSLTQI